MALKDLLALVDDTLQTKFSEKPQDPSKHRKLALARIDKAEAQFKNPSSKGKKLVRVSNGVAAFQPPFRIDDREVHHVPGERFPDYLKALRGVVSSGELDNSLHEWQTGGATAPRTPKGNPTAQRAGRPLDPEKVHARNVKRYGEARANELRQRRLAGS